jgi:hypothetical protein
MRLELASLVVGSFCTFAAMACGGRVDEAGSRGGRSGPERVDGSATSGGSSGSAAGNGRSPDCGPVSGAPRIIGPLRGSASNMVADANAVYWCESLVEATKTEPALVRWDVATGHLESLGTGDCSMLIGDGNDLWWSTVQRIGRMAKDGSGSGVLVRDETGAGQWYDLAADLAYVYWVDTWSPGGVYRKPKVGGANELLAPATFPIGIAVDGDAIYWGDEDGVKKRSKSTGEIVTLSTMPAIGTLGAKTLQIDDEYVYWTSSRGVERTPKGGGTSTQLVARGSDERVFAISIQAGCMYFGAGKKLYRRALTDGPEVELATSTGDRNIFYFSANETGVFWTDSSGDVGAGEVYMLPLSR